MNLPSIETALEIALKKSKEDFKKFLNRGEILTYDHIINNFQSHYHVNDHFNPSVEEKYKNNLKNWYDNICNLKFLSSVITNPQISEIIYHDLQNIDIDIHGKLNHLKIETETETETDAESEINNLTQDDVEMTITVLAITNKQAFNYSNPFCSFNMEIASQKLRTTLIHHSITPHQYSKLFIRKISTQQFNFKSFNLEGDKLELVLSAIKAKKNIIIAGATNSGKTSLLNTLLKEIPLNEHLVILEETHELSLSFSRANVTHLLSNEFHQKKTLTEYCNYALRLRPDRIIVGEVRGPEIIPLMLNLNTGHKGMISSLHANSAQEVIKRLALLYALYSEYKEINFNYLEKLIEQNIDMVIFMCNRVVSEVYEVVSLPV
ncbi:MAG: Flp pilus assembly complex ATPase component TadA [Oligoflexia bacterium]|nr:Flp pilus assembly complex ATPase component TadA [Oligoflexia bacterium]